MRKVLMLSAAAFIAAAGLSTAARAESGHWYTPFQVDACKKMPSQAGCIGFEKSVDPAMPVVDKKPATHKVRR